MPVAAGFVRGDSEYREIDLMDVLPPSLKGFSTQAQQLEFAQGYEQRTGILVKFPWESEQQRDARRAGFAPAPPPELGGDPVRLKRSLDRTINEIQTLTRDTPKYDEALLALVQRANKFERALGLKETVIAGVSAVVQEKAKEPEPATEAVAKYEQFSKLSDKKRKESAEATKDVEFLKLIRDRESVPAVVEAATLRLLELERSPS